MINISESRLFGFHLGLRQPSLQLNIQLEIPQIVDVEKIKTELGDRFLIEQAEIKYKLRRQLTRSEQVAAEFTWETLGLVCHLLQTIKIPCFDRGLILNINQINQSESRYLIAVQFPYVEHHSIVWIERSFGWAKKIISKIRHHQNDENEILEELFEELHEKFVDPVSKEVYGGGSTIPLLKTAYNMGIPFKHISWGIYQLGWANKLHITDRSTTELDSAVGRNMSHNKFQTAHFLRKAGLPAPIHFLAPTIELAIDAAKKIGYPIVVKPADKDRGEGVTVNVNDEDGVKQAYESALMLSKNILIEKQVPGICYRVLVMGKEVIYTVARMPMAVVGDGLHSIGELIFKANDREKCKAKHLRLKLFPSDDLANETLKNQGYQISSVPQNGIFVQLRPIETTEWGGLPKVYTEKIHPENIKIIIHAVNFLNLYTAGVDFITADISRPWYQNGAIINEINFAPYLGTRYEYQSEGIREILSKLFPSCGRIPIEIYIGNDDGWDAAIKRQKEWSESGVSSYVTSHLKTFDLDGEIHLKLEEEGLYSRALALLMYKNMEAMILVVQTDELLDKGLPVDSVSAVTVINNHLKLLTQKTESTSDTIVKMMVELIQPYLTKTSDAK